MKRKRPPSAPIGSRTVACLLILYSFLSLGVRTTPDHKSGRAHLQNVASRWAKLKFWKIEFLQLFHSKSGALYVKTPHFRAAFSALHLSSTHFGTPDWIRTSGLQSRSYQAVKPESPAAQGLGWCCTNLRHFMKKPQKPCATRLLRFFAVVVK